MNIAVLSVALVGLLTTLAWLCSRALVRTRRSLRTTSSRKRKILLKSMYQSGQSPVLFGFFHPYCNAGGGGERVLWAAIRATLDEHANAFCAIYTGDIEVDKDAILSRARNAFGIVLDADRIGIIHLQKRYLVSPETWPRFTLIGQSLGSIPLAFEALRALAPDIFIDTMGYAFTYPLVHLLLSIPIATYTHYPTISTDMLSQVRSRKLAKLAYWKAFALLYRYVGRYADVILANSTWTAQHLESLWGSRDIRILYPPCDTTSLRKTDVTSQRAEEIVCVAQFRKEKNHETLIKAFAFLVQQVNPTRRHKAKLILIGTVRNDEDRARVQDLQRLATELEVEKDVSFRLDVAWPDVLKVLSFAYIGTNAMWNEHFGIGVVEYMAAGLIPVVHDSAGPKLDIVTPYDGQSTGFHATDVQSFAKAFEAAFALSTSECIDMRRRAQAASQRFSEETFTLSWRQVVIDLLRLMRKKNVLSSIG